MLELNLINVHYGKMHVLNDVTLRVATGEVAALIGPNAAGQTTTLRMLVGLEESSKAHPDALGGGFETRPYKNRYIAMARSPRLRTFSSGTPSSCCSAKIEVYPPDQSGGMRHGR